MKKIKPEIFTEKGYNISMQINRIPIRQTARIFFGLAVSLIMILSLSTCKQIDLFPEYRGTNLISGKSLADWTPDQTDPYMNYEPVSGTEYEPPSDHANAEVYRLEIKNLIPNGDFEASTQGLPPDGWALVGGPTLEVINADNLGSGLAAGLINDKTMHFDLNTSADRVDYDLRDASYGSTDSFMTGASYLIHFNYKTASSIIFEYNTGAVNEYIKRWKVGGGINGSLSSPSLSNTIDFPPSELIGDFPDITVNSQSNQYYSFGSLEQGQPQEGYVDNFRLIRTDLTYKIRLSLSYKDDTAYPLISGYYRFSVYVKNDPAAGSSNRFASDRVCIGITGGGVSGNGSDFDESSFSNYAQYYNGQDEEDWSSWSEISVDLALQVPNSSSRAMELSICPTDDSKGAFNMDVGSILISSPNLEMFPDGFPQ